MLAPLPKRRICRLGLRLCSTNDDNQNDAISQDNSQDSRIELSDSIATTNSTGQPTKSPFGFLRNLKSVNKQSISKLGMSALLAYGFVSNVSGVLAVSSAWFIFSKRTGLSPIAPGQRTPFLALYAGFTVALNILRPARFALSMAISPYFERLRNFIQRKLGVTARVSALVMIVCVNIIGTCSLMGCGVGLASILSGVPIWKVAQ
ncbi:hypothetical protein ACHAWO_001254 [Cyclotella atomus]|uniref:Uncharacterized protein n=1 Tax=Cyclotella atomus TaxID=382360 RepID=A0ABD3P8I8_9STRA